VMILLMRFEVLCQLLDALTQKGDLDLWRTRIRFMDPVFGNYLRFLLHRQGHAKKRYSSSLP